MLVQIFSLVPITPTEEKKDAREETQTYKVGAPALKFQQSKFKIDPEPLHNPDRQVSYSLVYELDPDLQLPPVISLDEVDDSWVYFVVQTTDYILYANKKYTVGMKVSVAGFEGAMVIPDTWKLEVTHVDSAYTIPMGQPPFYEEPPEDIEVVYGTPFAMYLPTPQSYSEENEDEPITVVVEMGVARRFAKFNSTDSSLKIKEGMTSEDDMGEYLVKITLMTKSGLVSSYSFTLKVMDPASLISVPEEGELDSEDHEKRSKRLVYDEQDVEEIPKPYL